MKIYFFVFFLFLSQCAVVTGIITAETVDNDKESFLVDTKCSKCHTIKRVFIHARTEEEWKKTVERMQSEAGEYITEEDASRIAAFLTERSEALKEDIGSELFVAKCLVCHPPGEKVLLARHNKVEWEAVVKDRQQFAKNATPRIRIGTEDAAVIVKLLVKTQGPEPDERSP